MKKIIIIILIQCLYTVNMAAQSFDDFFSDKTLRIDYIFSGNTDNQSISVDKLCQLATWAGRRYHLAELPLKGNGEIEMKDIETQKIIYKTSFSTLFQEWLTTEEAKKLSKGFENTYLLPYPLNPCKITISLKDNKGNYCAQLVHNVTPNDILIHSKAKSDSIPFKYLLNSGSTEECIDVVILAEGYTAKEMKLFYKDAQSAYESLFTHEPFKSLKQKFNIIAVGSESKDSGVSIPRKSQWKDTAFESHFDTFYSDRYLTTGCVRKIHDLLTDIPYEHIIILANTDAYGGGGIYNAFTLTSTHHKNFKPVIVHEFGHSFAGLADEYFYEKDIFSDTYLFNIEPWEQNITTLVDFSSKWKDMLSPTINIPTPIDSKSPYKIGVYEGGGYSSKGIYRPAFNCRMRTNEATQFCPVCQRAIERMILFYTEKEE